MPSGGRLRLSTFYAEPIPNSERGRSGEWGSTLAISVEDTGFGNAAGGYLPSVRTILYDEGNRQGLRSRPFYGLWLRQTIGWQPTYREHSWQRDPGDFISAGVRLGSPNCLCSSTTGRREIGSGTILIVEDNKAVREVTVEIIRNLGYETLTASNGQEALKLLRQTEALDLLFTDLVMPGPLTGLALAREAQIMRPGLPVLLSTGYAALDKQAENEFPVIAKPFRAAELSRVISGLILNKPPEADCNS